MSQTVSAFNFFGELSEAEQALRPVSLRSAGSARFERGALEQSHRLCEEDFFFLRFAPIYRHHLWARKRAKNTVLLRACALAAEPRPDLQVRRGPSGPPRPPGR